MSTYNTEGALKLSNSIQLINTTLVEYPKGNVLFENTLGATTDANFTWTVPANVFNISYVVVGGGGVGSATLYTSFTYASGGNGGGLAYRNNVPVTPGDVVTVVCGRGGKNKSSYGSTGDYYYQSSNSSVTVNGVRTVATGGDQAANILVGGYPAGVYSGGGRGGGRGQSYHTSPGPGLGTGGGGGAGGYSGQGGFGKWADGIGFTVGKGGGGAGGTGGVVTTSQRGGGVGLYGQGKSGAVEGEPGSGGEGYYYGGGGYAQLIRYVSGAIALTQAGPGAVRIIWGYNRMFPNTNTAFAQEGTDLVYVKV